MSGESRLREQGARGRGGDDMVGRSRDEADAPEDTARIRSEIVRTREDMSETIDAIQDKLSPRNLVSQARESVKEATVGRVKEAARSVSRSASGLAEQTRGAAAEVGDTFRSNPWPALMIGAGTAWMLFNASRKKSRAEGSFDDTRFGDETAGTASYYQAVRTRSPYGDDSRDQSRSATGALSQASSEFRGLLYRNPLAVGAVAAAVGVAVGLAIPETEKENELMGEARDNLVERAQGAAQGAVQKAKEVAGEAAKQVTGTATNQR